MIIVVLPAYNEQGSIGPLLVGIAGAISKDEGGARVIVVNDGSTDATANEVRAHNSHIDVELIDRANNEGLAFTLDEGLRQALACGNDGDVIVTMDGDNTHPPELTLSLLNKITNGCDVCIASRFQPGAVIEGLTRLRRITGWGASSLMRILFPTRNLRDYTCGYRAYRYDVLKRAYSTYGDGFISERGFSCSADLVLKLRRLDLRWAEIPLTLRYDRKTTPSKMNITHTIAQTLWLLIRRRLGFYGQMKINSE